MPFEIRWTFIGIFIGALLALVFSLLLENFKNRESKKSVAYLFKQELELNLELIRILQKEHSSDRTLEYEKPKRFRVYDHFIRELPLLGFRLSTDMKWYYDMLDLTYEELSRPHNEKVKEMKGYMAQTLMGKKIGTDMDSLITFGQTIVEELEEISKMKVYYVK